MGLPVLDEHGAAALHCAADGSALAPAPGEPLVLVCTRCGRRTDEPGTGVLGDGFDVVHRQWGLRGDPHAWAALRDLVADTPTPATAEEVRAAYVAGLARVVGVDVDTSDQHQVIRGELDHGGMSGGVVDLDWWRSKGIPLLVDRALDRRPSAPGAEPGPAATASRVRRLAADVAVWAFLVTVPAALLGGGGWLLYQRAVGTWTEATVLECESSGAFRRYGADRRTDCVAEWTVDGRTVVGDYVGGDGVRDVGRTVDVTLRGDTAYSRSLGLPLLLVALGLPFLVLLVITLRSAWRTRRSPGPRE